MVVTCLSGSSYLSSGWNGNDGIEIYLPNRFQTRLSCRCKDWRFSVSGICPSVKVSVHLILTTVCIWFGGLPDSGPAEVEIFDYLDRIREHGGGREQRSPPIVRGDVDRGALLCSFFAGASAYIL